MRHDEPQDHEVSRLGYVLIRQDRPSSKKGEADAHPTIVPDATPLHTLLFVNRIASKLLINSELTV